jgi:hypothetical protein
LEEKDKWLKVRFPDSAEIWAPSKSLRGDSLTDKTALRAGPGPSFPFRGEAAPDWKITALSAEKDGWTKISPPEELPVWISAEFADRKSKAEPPQETSEPKASPAAAVSEKETPPDTNIGLLPPARSLAGTAERRGVVAPLKPNAVYVTHALVTVSPSGDIVPVCWLHSPTERLDRWEGKTVTVKGPERKVEGWGKPVLEAVQISEEKQER